MNMFRHQTRINLAKKMLQSGEISEKQEQAFALWLSEA
jgi:hypothetical protein